MNIPVVSLPEVNIPMNIPHEYIPMNIPMNIPMVSDYSGYSGYLYKQWCFSTATRRCSHCKPGSGARGGRDVLIRIPGEDGD